MKRKHKNRARPKNYNRIIVENCINAYVDGGNDIQAMWKYLRTLIDNHEITEPYAKIKAKESLDCIKETERIYLRRLQDEEVKHNTRNY